MKHRYEEMLPHEYEAARAAAPIAYLPWGAHEWHGAHNALGLDSLKAHHLCQEMAKKTLLTLELPVPKPNVTVPVIELFLKR